MRFPAATARIAITSAKGRAFTLIELMVSIAIVATLVALLLPAIGRTIGAARGFRCQTSLRSIAFDFTVFADEQLHGDRGNDPAEIGPRRFRLETFQASQYGLNEFWRWGNLASYTLPDAANNDPMRCTEVKGPITLLSNTPCSSAITPSRNVSFGFNMRLHLAQIPGASGQPHIAPVLLTSSILEHPRVPLVWDIDGQVAATRNTTPIFSAPDTGLADLFASNAYWFPARRHNGAINFAFIDGSVTSSRSPLEMNWAWSFQPAP